MLTKTEDIEKTRDNLKGYLMESRDNLMGKFVVFLTSGHTFLADKVFYFKQNDNRQHFRFYISHIYPGANFGERRIEHNRIISIYNLDEY